MKETKIVDSKKLGIDWIESPTCSPDGSQVAFGAGFDDEFYDIWVVNSDGTDWANLTNGRFNNQSPYWAMENAILFTSDRGGDWDIYSITPEGRDLKQLTNTNRIDETNPSFPQGASLSVTTVGKLSTRWGNIKSQ